MIHLMHDVFSALATSAKTLKDEELNKHINQSLSKGVFSQIEMTDYNPVKIKYSDMRHHALVKHSKPIEETVDDLIENPEIKALKAELDNVEDLFYNLKEEGKENNALFRIEKRIQDLKRIIEEKSYV